jgi:hypothetical protein
MDRATAAKANQTFVLELNEVNFSVLSDLATAGRLPAFNRLFQTHTVIPTIAQESYAKLEPWIQWVSAHSGLSQAGHGAFNLTDGQHANFDQLWDILEDAGIACGIVSPMNARRGRLHRGFYLPDPWSVTRDAYPDELAPIDRFVSERVNNHNISLEKGSSRAAFAEACLEVGISPRALARLGWHYLRSRLDARRKWRLAAQFDRFVVEATLAMMRQRPVGHVSVFLNAVAHYQHHYWTRHNPRRWAQAAPDLFRQANPLDQTVLHADDDPITYGLVIYDRILARIRRRLPEAQIFVMTALSQVPFDGYAGGRGFYLYRPFDHQALADALGLGATRVVSLMSRDLMLYFTDDAARSRAMARLKACVVGSEPVFFCAEETESRLFVKVAYTFPADTSTMIARGSEPALPFNAWFKLITFKTGHHHPEGFLICPPALAPSRSLLVEGRLPVEKVFDVLLAAHGLARPSQLAAEPVRRAS